MRDINEASKEGIIGTLRHYVARFLNSDGYIETLRCGCGRHISMERWYG